MLNLWLTLVCVGSSSVRIGSFNRIIYIDVYILRVYICKFNILTFFLRVESENTNCSTHLTTHKAHRYHMQLSILYLYHCLYNFLNSLDTCLFSVYVYICVYMLVVYEICIFYV